MSSDLNVYDYLFADTRTSDKSFLLGAKESITFEKLYTNSLAVAGYLQHNAGKGQHIPVLSQNNLFFITAYLGILKSGNIAVPLNPAIETENLSYIIKQCDCTCAFISQTVTNRESHAILYFNEETLEQMISADMHIINPGVESDEVAEVIFTSGSTGVPKGVMITHRNLIANTSSIIKYLHLRDNDTMLVVLPFYYCYGLSLLHTHLRVGGAIALNNSFIFLGGIIRDLNQYKCTGFAGVPSHYQILLRKSKSFVTTAFPHLRYVTQAGGKLPAAFILEFTQAFPHILFYVMYGQTEATARLSYLSPEKVHEKRGSIGKAIPGIILKIINEDGFEVKPGEAGEIIAHGENIMKGYYKDEVLTASTIRDGWLHTGDIATRDEEGYIFIVSRKKEILKVGGKRISPKEIEEVILMLPAVIDCTITGMEDPLLGEAIQATIVLTDEGKKTLGEKEILDHCHRNLAMYKVPSKIVFEDALKMNATGKKMKA